MGLSFATYGLMRKQMKTNAVPGLLVEILLLLLFTLALIAWLHLQGEAMFLYVTPSLQFVSGVLLLGEAFDFNKLVGFIGIWIGLAVFSYSLLARRDSPDTAAV